MLERPTASNNAIEWAQARLFPQHALASAAIPIIFPTVRVAGRMYSDGSLRQNTPIAPALRLGAGRALIVGLRARTKPAPLVRQAPDERQAFYRGVWDNWRWRLLCRAFFSRWVMGRLGRDPRFFDYVEGGMAEHVRRRQQQAEPLESDLRARQLWHRHVADARGRDPAGRSQQLA